MPCAVRKAGSLSKMAIDVRYRSGLQLAKLYAWLIIVGAASWSVVDANYNCIDLCSCRLNGSNIVADCTGLNLTEVPQPDIYQIDVFILNFNYLSFIRIDSFEHFTKLKDVRLSGNRIRLIESGAFVPLQKSNLVSLDLSRNQLKRLPPSELNRLSGSLEHLTVSFNALSSFPSAVRGLSSLKELDLSHNVISYLPKGSLPANLISLNLAFTSIRRFTQSAFANSAQLRHLVLSDNLASGAVQFEARTFDGLVGMEHLDLSRCYCKRLPPSSFTQMPNLTTLLLQSSYIQSVPTFSMPDLLTTKGPEITDFPETSAKPVETPLDGGDDLLRRRRSSPQPFNNSDEFDMMSDDSNASPVGPSYHWCNPKLTTLDLSHNRKLDLVGVDANNNNNNRSLFPPSLRSLDVGYTTVRVVRKSYFANLHLLTYLNLCSSRVSSVEENAFVSLTSLKSICLSENPLSAAPRLPPSVQEINITSTGVTNLTRRFLARTSNVTSFDLSNGHLASIESRAFQNMFRLRLLNLSMNSLEELEETTLWIGNNGINSSLEVLDLALNRLSVINGAAFASHTNLLRLNLHGNNLLEINEQTLAGLVNLKILDLSRNSLIELALMAFRDLLHVEEIFLNDNDLEVVIENQFVSAVHLQKLHLADNRLLDVRSQFFPSLIILDLKRNNISDFPLLVGENLISLDLSFNDLEHIPAGSLHGLFNLETLDLQENNVLSVYEYSTFFDTPNLRRLDLSKCNVWKMVDVELPALRTLKLGSNSISSIDSGIEKHLPAIEELDLSFNHLTTLYPAAFNSSETLKGLDLNGNNFLCDCQLLPLVDWIKDKIEHETMDVIGASYYLCEKPHVAYSQPILLFVDQLDCSPPVPPTPTVHSAAYVIEVVLGVLAGLAVVVAVGVACYCRLRTSDTSSSSLSSVIDDTSSDRRSSLSACCEWVATRLPFFVNSANRSRNRGFSDDEGRNLMITTPLATPTDPQPPEMLL